MYLGKMNIKNPQQVIRINNPDKLADIAEAAKKIINHIETGWDSNLKNAESAYYGMNWIGRLCHSFASSFTHKDKFSALKKARKEHNIIYGMQHANCCDILNKTKFYTSIDLTKTDCHMLQLNHLWDKYSKIGVRK